MTGAEPLEQFVVRRERHRLLLGVPDLLAHDERGPAVHLAGVLEHVARVPLGARRHRGVEVGARAGRREQRTLARQRVDVFGDLHQSRVFHQSPRTRKSNTSGRE